MNREPKAPPLRSWQVFSAGIYHLKKDFLAKMFGVSLRQVERWAADPDTTESHQKNPLDRLEAMCRAFMARGQSEIARIMAARLAYVVNCELRELDPVEPDAETMQHECLDDYPPVTRFHEAINQGGSIEEVRHLWQAAKRELDETFEMYLREWKDGQGGMPEKQKGARD
jgi:hypothetical protein